MRVTILAEERVGDTVITSRQSFSPQSVEKVRSPKELVFWTYLKAIRDVERRVQEEKKNE